MGGIIPFFKALYGHKSSDLKEAVDKMRVGCITATEKCFKKA